jgi:hypothetical protein
MAAGVFALATALDAAVGGTKVDAEVPPHEQRKIDWDSRAATAIAEVTEKCFFIRNPCSVPLREPVGYCPLLSVYWYWTLGDCSIASDEYLVKSPIDTSQISLLLLGNLVI